MEKFAEVNSRIYTAFIPFKFHLFNNDKGKSMKNVKLLMVSIILIGLGGCISYSSKEETTAPPASSEPNRVIVDPD